MLNRKTLKPNEENIKELLEELLRLYVNMPKKAIVQKKIVVNIINGLKSNRLTFIQLFNMLFTLMHNAKDKETIAISSNIFNKFQETYKNVLKEKP
jgi:hypothetical protein